MTMKLSLGLNIVHIVVIVHQILDMIEEIRKSTRIITNPHGNYLMTRCQRCKKLTHPEDLYVSYKMEDFEKVHELICLENWTPKYMYNSLQLEACSKNEYGKLKCGDIYIHFLVSE